MKLLFELEKSKTKRATVHAVCGPDVILATPLTKAAKWFSAR